jgi:hypothetical protein
MMLFPKFLDIAMPDYHKWKKRNHKQVAPVYSGTPCPPAWRPGNPLSISCTSPEPFGGGAPRQAMRVENHVGVPLSAMNSLGGQVRMLKASSFGASISQTPGKANGSLSLIRRGLFFSGHS